MMERSEALIGQLKELRRLGVTLTIDDFGTCCSNLAYLKAFPLSRLKVDRWFVHELVSDPGAIAITGEILALGKSFGLKVLAEGIETVEQADLLSGMGCEEAQGFLDCRPIPPREVEIRLVEAMRGTVAGRLSGFYINKHLRQPRPAWGQPLHAGALPNSPSNLAAGVTRQTNSPGRICAAAAIRIRAVCFAPHHQSRSAGRGFNRRALSRCHLLWPNKAIR